MTYYLASSALVVSANFAPVAPSIQTWVTYIMSTHAPVRCEAIFLLGRTPSAHSVKRPKAVRSVRGLVRALAMAAHLI